MKRKRVLVKFDNEVLGVCRSINEAAIKTNVSTGYIREILDSGMTCRGYLFESPDKKEEDLND